MENFSRIVSRQTFSMKGINRISTANIGTAQLVMHHSLETVEICGGLRGALTYRPNYWCFKETRWKSFRSNVGTASMLPPKRSLNSSTFFLLLVFTNVLLGCSANHESFVVSRLNESECSFDSLLGLRDFVRTLVYGLGVYDRFPWRSANQIAKFLQIQKATAFLGSYPRTWKSDTRAKKVF